MRIVDINTQLGKHASHWVHLLDQYLNQFVIGHYLRCTDTDECSDNRH